MTTQESETYKIALLIKNTAFNKLELQSNYMDPLIESGIDPNEVIAFTLEYTKPKISATEIREYLDKLMPVLQDLRVEYLYVADANYFKVMAGVAKTEPHQGYVPPCKIKGYEHMQVVLGLNHQQLIYNPDLKEKLLLGLNALSTKVQGTYQSLGSGIIHSAQYPSGTAAIADALKALHQYPELTCDIEAFSLKFNEAGIGTISFAWNQHNGIAFACDYTVKPPVSANPCGEIMIDSGRRENNPEIRTLLREFFETYQGRLTFHRCTYDVKVIIYCLWMKDALDTDGLLKGLEIMCKHMDDTRIIAYLATNSCAGNELGLKQLAHEFAGNWAVESINDIRKIELPKLLQYNLVDSLSTFYVKNKYYPIMVQDKQEDLYHSLMMPSQKLIIQLELTGMPMSRTKIQETKKSLEDLLNGYRSVLIDSPVIKALELIMTDHEWEADYQARKAKAKNPHKIQYKDRDTYATKEFNPGSGPQLQRLLYEMMGLPVIDYTDTKQPATGGDTLEKLIHHAPTDAYKEIIKALIGHAKVSKILNSFIPAFEEAISKDASDTVWLHGSFNLGGTVSGRLSSSDPNLQNIPAGSTFAKLIKECFVASQGWLFTGADFNSLEDYISALTTKDPNKLKVYEEGFDGHALRAVFYFRDELMDINPDDPKSVNILKIKGAHPKEYLRQESKAPTFALTYQGTWMTLVNNLGWSEEKAKKIEANYHELYKVSDAYVQDKLRQASKDGFVEVAFGLRVRTPMLKQIVFGSSRVPKEAAAEGRTAGNALGQSYGLLNNRAAVEFFQRVWASPYRLDILPVALIHDAIYILIRDDIDVVTWANKNLIDCMRWQELPEIQHSTVKLGAALDIFHPSWAHPITLPNDASPQEIRATCDQAMEERRAKALT